MRPWLVAILIVAISQLRLVDNSHIGFFASTGTYSHDMLLKNMAERLLEDGDNLGVKHRVTIIQILVFEFDRNLPKVFDSSWDYIVYNASDTRSAQIQRSSQRFMWTTTLPWDTESVWKSVTSAVMFYDIHRSHMRACERALTDSVFMDKFRALLDLDLLVIDHILNDCAVGLAHKFLPGVKVAYASNYSPVSAYMESMGAPSNPSYVPATIIRSEREPMCLYRRGFNAFIHAVTYGFRRVHHWAVQRAFRAAIGERLQAVGELERRLVAFGTPMEMLIDSPRPQTQGIKYFGCEHCGAPPVEGEEGDISELLHIPPGPRGYIVVSFGTMTNGDQIPIDHLSRVWWALGAVPDYAVVWQLDAQRELYEDGVLRALNWTELPAHVHLIAWMPLKAVLSDPRVALALVHGGLRTCMEAVRGGVPLLGLAIHGDQQYVLRRLDLRGVAKGMRVTTFTKEKLLVKIQEILLNNRSYKNSVIKLRAMLRDHKTLGTRSPSAFWLSWAARRYSSKNVIRSIFTERVATSKHSLNLLVYHSLDMLFLMVICAMVGWKLMIV